MLLSQFRYYNICSVEIAFPKQWAAPACWAIKLTSRDSCLFIVQQIAVRTHIKLQTCCFIEYLLRRYHEGLLEFSFGIDNRILNNFVGWGHQNHIKRASHQKSWGASMLETCRHVVTSAPRYQNAQVRVLTLGALLFSAPEFVWPAHRMLGPTASIAYVLHTLVRWRSGLVQTMMGKTRVLTINLS
jgi:hypothetical protein